MKRVLQVLAMVVRPLPQLSAWGRVSIFLGTLLVTAGMVQFELQHYLPRTLTGWAALAFLLAFLSLFTRAVHLQAQIENTGGLSWRLIDARVDAREELSTNPPENRLHNVLLCSVRYEIRNGSDREMTLCPIPLSVYWTPPGHWRRAELKLANRRLSWGRRDGAHIGDYKLAPRSREEARSNIRGQLPPAIFSQVKKSQLVAEVTFDIIGQAKKVERVPLVWRST